MALVFLYFSSSLNNWDDLNPALVRYQITSTTNIKYSKSSRFSKIELGNNTEIMPRDKPRTTGNCDCGCEEPLNVGDATYCWKCIRYDAKLVLIN